MGTDQHHELTADLEAMVEAFEDQWHSKISFTDFLPDRKSTNFGEIACELVRIDLEHRWRAGEQPVVETYLTTLSPFQFDGPQLSEIAFEEYRLRFQFGEPQDRELFRQRFGIETANWLHWSQASCPNSTDTNWPQIGEEFCGFQLIGILGQGAFGRVFLARQMDLAQRLVALKVTKESGIESQVLARLQHTNIIPIFSVQQWNGMQAICMPLLGVLTLTDLFSERTTESNYALSGRELISTVAERKIQTVRSSTQDNEVREQLGIEFRQMVSMGESQISHERWPETMLWFAGKLAEGLACAHDKGIVHGDLKPDNVLISDDGQPILLDFNLASEPNSNRQRPHMGGTLAYMNGEHLQAFLSGAPARPSFDIFSLGVLLYQGLSGRLPYPQRGQNLHQLQEMILDRQTSPKHLLDIVPFVSPSIASIVDRCLNAGKASGYETVHQVREDIFRHLDNLPLKHAPNRSVGENIKKWIRRHPRLSSLTAISVASVATILFIIGWYKSQVVNVRRLEAMEQSRNYLESLHPMVAALTVPEISSSQLEKLQTELSHAIQERDGIRSTASLRLTPSENHREINATRLAQYWLARTEFSEALNERDLSAKKFKFQRALEHIDNAQGRGDDFPVSLATLRQTIKQAQSPSPIGNVEENVKTKDVESALPLDRLLIAAELDRGGDGVAARRELAKLISESPKNYQAWLMLGHVNQKLGLPDASEICYDMCVELDSKCSWGYFCLGLLHFKLQRFEQAILDFNSCLEIDPGDTTSRLNRGLAYRNLEELEKASQDFTTAIEAGCTETRVFLLRSQVYQRLGQRELAQADYLRFIALEPQDAKSCLSRGLAFAQSQKFDSALLDFQRALEFDPLEWSAYQNIATVQAEYLNNADAAIEALSSILEQKPDEVVTLVTRGVLYARKGDASAAIADCQRALSMRSNADIQFRAAGVFALLSTSDPTRADQAIRLLRQAAGLDPKMVSDRLRDDGDLNAIRNNDQFVKLSSQIEALLMLTGKESEEKR